MIDDARNVKIGRNLSIESSLAIFCQWKDHWQILSTGSSLANTGQRAVHWQTPVNGQFTGEHCQWRVHWQALSLGS
jgi:hypothetical protein